MARKKVAVKEESAAKSATTADLKSLARAAARNLSSGLVAQVS